MPFASYAFLAFMAVLLPVYYLAARSGARAARLVLIGASLVFYGYWIPGYLVILVGSIVVNYTLGEIVRARRGTAAGQLLFALGIAANLGLIGWYKYAAFIAESINSLLGFGLDVPHVLLPIGISFFTFQQVGYLVDMSKGQVERSRFLDYVFFIVFFPQLIAGPIVTQADMLPQLRARTDWRLRAANLMPGIALFSAGLFKKTVLSDMAAPYADKLFSLAASGTHLGPVDAWMAAICYAFQIYFDFSGYSDMAIGLGFMFGFRLPINFHSPYKAAGIRDFWRRWHITLSRFLRDYLYIPLGGSRHGMPRTVLALLGTMTLGGLWHGAGANFVIWGFLHGLALAAAHLFRPILPKVGEGGPLVRAIKRAAYVLVTFIFVTFSWVWFRAPDVGTALAMTRSMVFAAGTTSFVTFDSGIYPYLPLYFLIVWALPNTNENFRAHRMALHVEMYAERRYPWLLRELLVFRYLKRSVVVTAIAFTVSWFALSNLSPFIYFQF
ncbi:MAG TPA: MBOAT family O-acyltransferase [Devosiaceae bacterium]